MKQPSDARDFGPKARHDRGDLTEVALDVDWLKNAKAKFECVLDRYQDRAQISDRQHEAGTRLRHLWRRAILPPSTTGGYAPPVSGGGDAADTAGARKKLANALLGAYVKTTGEHIAQRSPISGKWLLVITRTGKQHFPETMPWRLLPLGHILLAVCGFDEWAGGTQRLVDLREGLSALADYWQIEH